jgi:hypothetical protein
MRRLIYTLISLIILTSTISISVCESYSENIIKVNQIESGIELNLPTIDTLFKIETEAESSPDTHEFITIESVGITEYELYLLCAITQAEAGNQSDLGKELVVVTILNRLHSVDRWGDSINELITYSQFNGVSNPNFGYRSDETYASVMSAIEKYYKCEYKDEWYKIFYFNNPNDLDSQKYMDKYGLYVIIDEGEHRFMGEGK